VFFSFVFANLTLLVINGFVNYLRHTFFIFSKISRNRTRASFTKLTCIFGANNFWEFLLRNTYIQCFQTIYSRHPNTERLAVFGLNLMPVSIIRIPDSPVFGGILYSEHPIPRRFQSSNGLFKLKLDFDNRATIQYPDYTTVTGHPITRLLG
jgi:hypothetical protein